MHKNMKLHKLLAVAVAGLILASCGEDFLTSHTTHQGAAGAEATEGAILSYLTAAYQPLLMDSYANYNYNHILLLSDLRSDDIFKGGGDAGDQSWMYHLSLFQIPASESPTGIWTLYYSAIARANNTVLAIDNAVGFDSDAAKARLAGYRAEALFLRAYYLHHLWKLFGNIPFFTEPLEDPFMAPQKTADQIYADIMTDIAAAATPPKSAYCPKKNWKRTIEAQRRPAEAPREAAKSTAKCSCTEQTSSIEAQEPRTATKSTPRSATQSSWNGKARSTPPSNGRATTCRTGSCTPNSPRIHRWKFTGRGPRTSRAGRSSPTTST